MSQRSCGFGWMWDRWYIKARHASPIIVRFFEAVISLIPEMEGEDTSIHTPEWPVPPGLSFRKAISECKPNPRICFSKMWKLPLSHQIWRLLEKTMRLAETRGPREECICSKAAKEVAGIGNFGKNGSCIEVTKSCIIWSLCPRFHKLLISFEPFLKFVFNKGEKAGATLRILLNFLNINFFDPQLQLKTNGLRIYLVFCTCVFLWFSFFPQILIWEKREQRYSQGRRSF